MIKALVSWTVKLMILGLVMMGVVAMMSPSNTASDSVKRVLNPGVAGDDIDDSNDRDIITPAKNIDSSVEKRALHSIDGDNAVHKVATNINHIDNTWNAADVKNLISANMPNMYLYLASKLRVAMNKIHAPIF